MSLVTTTYSSHLNAFWARQGHTNHTFQSNNSPAPRVSASTLHERGAPCRGPEHNDSGGGGRATHPIQNINSSRLDWDVCQHAARHTPKLYLYPPNFGRVRGDPTPPHPAG